MERDLWIIESNAPSGHYTGVRPDQVFGMGAIHGMSSHAISEVIFRLKKDEEITIPLTGFNIPLWPKNINHQWVARRKTW